MFKDERDFDSPDSVESEDTGDFRGIYRRRISEKFARSVEALLSKCAKLLDSLGIEREPVWLNDHAQNSTM